MKTRLAYCGHEYQVPDSFWGGQRRKNCDECIALAPVPEGRKALILNARAARTAAHARGVPARPPRQALCGHEVPYHGGPPRRMCDDCSKPPERSCPVCGTDLTYRRALVKYCTSRCGEIALGRRLPEPIAQRVCALPECGAPFQPKSRTQRCCSERHGKMLCNRTGRAEGRYKPEPWNDRRRDGYHRRRAAKKGASTGRPVRLDEIAVRDGWQCHLCRRKVDPRHAWPHPLSPSLDHVIPLRPSDGSEPGAHDPSNVRLAHLRCNVAKGNRSGGEQLMLFG